LGFKGLIICTANFLQSHIKKIAKILFRNREGDFEHESVFHTWNRYVRAHRAAMFAVRHQLHALATVNCNKPHNRAPTSDVVRLAQRGQQLSSLMRVISLSQRLFSALKIPYLTHPLIPNYIQ
jgi:hypothetical protein